MREGAISAALALCVVVVHFDMARTLQVEKCMSSALFPRASGLQVRLKGSLN